MEQDIVISGAGIVSAIGLDKDEVLASLLAKRTGIGEMHYLGSVHRELPVGEVRLSNDEMRERLGIGDVLTSRTVLMAMMAVKQALGEAGIATTQTEGTALPEGADRAILISGTSVGGIDVTETIYNEMQVDDDVLAFAKRDDCGSCTGEVAGFFGIFSDHATISTACSSAANAIILGANLIKAGQADVVVAGGTDALSLFHLNGFNTLMIIDHERCRPFDATRKGLNLGEGAGFIVLETAAHAAQRGAKVLAHLSGYGNACDAYHQTASSDNGEGAYRAMCQALDMAGLEPSAIDYINAHGTGTPNNDLSESVAMRRVFGDNVPPMSSTKSFTGHTTGASGGIEAVICLLALQHQFLPANIGWEHPFEGGVVPTMGAEGVRVAHVLSNAFGFGGNDSALLFSAHSTDTKPMHYDPDVQIKVLASVTVSDEEELQEIRQYVKPLEVRRMGKLMKSALLSSLKALAEAGVETPDAIVMGTGRGCLENCEKYLLALCNEGEYALKPTLFMQSTHNTIAGSLAIRTGCHGYNTTYTQSDKSLEWALRDAELLLRSGQAKTVLVGCHNETAPLYKQFMQRLGIQLAYDQIHSTSIVLTCADVVQKQEER